MIEDQGQGHEVVREVIVARGQDQDRTLLKRREGQRSHSLGREKSHGRGRGLSQGHGLVLRERSQGHGLVRGRSQGRRVWIVQSLYLRGV